MDFNDCLEAVDEGISNLGWAKAVVDTDSHQIFLNFISNVLVSLANFFKLIEGVTGVDALASHDLKEPLRMVTLYMQMLEKHASIKLNEDELQYLYYAKEGANRMYDLINSLLSLSKINPDVKRETVDFNKVLADVTEFLCRERDQYKFR